MHGSPSDWWDDRPKTPEEQDEEKLREIEMMAEFFGLIGWGLVLLLRWPTAPLWVRNPRDHVYFRLSGETFAAYLVLLITATMTQVLFIFFAVMVWFHPRQLMAQAAEAPLIAMCVLFALATVTRIVVWFQEESKL